MNNEYFQLKEKAFSLHNSGNYAEARKLYEQLISLNSDDTNILNLYGLLLLSMKRYDDAVTQLSKAFILNHSAYIASNLAKAYYMNGDIVKSIVIFKQALDIEPSDDIYYSLALAYKQLKDYDNVILNYKKAININPKHYSSLYNLSLAYKVINDVDNAIIYALKCIEIKPEDEDIFVLLSGYYEAKRDYNNALIYINKACLINKNNYLYFYNQGVLNSKLNNIKQAIISYKTAINLNASYIQSYVNISHLIKDNNKEEALDYLLKAYKINQNEESLCLTLAQLYREMFKNKESIIILNNFLLRKKNSAAAFALLAINYMDLCNYKQALNFYNMALNLEPDNLNYQHGKAVALKYLDQISESKEILENIVKKDSNTIQSITTLGMIYLSERDFDKGMPLYIQRSKENKFSKIFKEKIWNNKVSLSGKNILVYTDCGLGDTVMYCRYLKKLKQISANITLQTDKDLLKILKYNFPDINIISKSEIAPQYNIVIPIMNLQYALNSDFNNIPDVNGYLKIDNEKIIKFSNIKPVKNKVNKIGLFWKGNKRIFKNRFIDFSLISSLFNLKNCNFYSFQIDEYIEETENVFNLKSYINDYTDTAALLKNMDILITIDSSIAHISGALGVKTFLLLPHTPEWRWFNDNEKSSWYNSVKIFRQNEPNNWQEVIKLVENEIRKL